MKRILLVGVLVFTLVIGAFAVYADSPATGEFGFGRGYGHMGGNAYGHMNNSEFNRRIDLTEEEREEWFQNRQNFFEERENFTEEERQEWFNEMQDERAEYREERIKLALQEGTITEEQAAEWRTHFEEMDKFHEENGFVGRGFQGGMMGRGHGRANGMMGGCGF